jgi:hypothetical protein
MPVMTSQMRNFAWLTPFLGFGWVLHLCIPLKLIEIQTRLSGIGIDEYITNVAFASRDGEYHHYFGVLSPRPSTDDRAHALAVCDRHGLAR